FLTQAIKGDDPGPPALKLARLYLKRRHEGDLLKARENFEIAAAANKPEAHLALAEMASEDYQDTSERKSMTEHFVEAAKLLGAEEVAVRMMRMPQAVLIAAVQELLVELGFGAGSVGSSSP